MPGKTTSKRAPTRTIHHRVTAPRSHKAGTRPGMHRASAVTQAGTTTHFRVSYVTSLGQEGADLAGAILQTCEQDYNTLSGIFGGLTPEALPFVVEITSDNTGASHSSCMGTDISIGGKSGSNVDFIRSLLVAEEDEVFMANFGHGWNCGASNGEGLSRVLADDIYKNVEPADFISSNVWLNLDPRPDYVDETEPTDTDYNSIGCSVLFLNWLRSQLNYSWQQIVDAGTATLARTYTNLTGKNTAWQDFEAVINAHFPLGQQYNLDTDNPFPVAG